MKSNKYEVIIIGSGIGGLVLGALLSKKKKVLLLEKESHFGGYCGSFKRGNFNFEIAIEAINGLNKGQVIYDIFSRSGALKNSSFISPKYLYRSIYPDYDLRFPQKDINQYKKMLSTLFKKEKKNIDFLVNEMRLIYQDIDTLDKERKLVRSPNIMRYYKTAFEDLLNKYITDCKLKTIFSQYWVYCGIPPSMLSSVTFSYIWYDYTCNGSFYPKNGTGRLANEFANVIKENKGDTLLNSEVLKIYNKDGKAIEVELTSGRHFTADVFVSNMDIQQTFNMLTEKPSDIEKYIKKFDTKETSISAFKVYLGLNVNLKKVGITDCEIFLNPNYDLDMMYNASLKNNTDNAPVSVVVYSNLSDTLCPRDRSVISITMLSGYDFWKEMNENTYKLTKEKIADDLIKRAEIVIPKLREYIEEKVIATPLTMERHTNNTRGAIYGWSKGNLYDEIRFMKVTTPIKNLFLSNHWTKIGGGIAGVVRTAERAHRLLEK